MNELKKKNSHWNGQILIPNQAGSALVLTMILLAVLTTMALSSMNLTVTESRIVRNERIYQDNFYRAESAAREAAKQIELASDADLSDQSFSTFTWLKDAKDNDLTDYNNWNTATNSASATGLENTEYSVVQRGIARGSSLDMTRTTNMYDYAARGYAHDAGGRVIIELGYRRRH